MSQSDGRESVRSAAATRARILQAAAKEFAAHGLAGARIDRIAAAAKANKQLLYAYFGDKKKLFEIVLNERLIELFEAVPFTPHDLPNYVGKLFDFLMNDQEYRRLSAWRRLEVPHLATSMPKDAFRSWLQQIAECQDKGVITSRLAPAEILMLLTALPYSWVNSPQALRHQLPVDTPDALTERRKAVIEAARRIIAPGADCEVC